MGLYIGESEFFSEHTKAWESSEYRGWRASAYFGARDSQDRWLLLKRDFAEGCVALQLQCSESGLDDAFKRVADLLEDTVAEYAAPGCRCRLLRWRNAGWRDYVLTHNGRTVAVFAGAEAELTDADARARAAEYFCRAGIQAKEVERPLYMRPKS